MSARDDRTHAEDDGRTIADMSGVGRQPLLFPHLPERRAHAAPPAPRQEKAARPWEDAGLSKKEQLWYMLGALKAALLVALVFIAGLGAVVLLFLLGGK